MCSRSLPISDVIVRYECTILIDRVFRAASIQELRKRCSKDQWAMMRSFLLRSTRLDEDKKPELKKAEKSGLDVSALG